jgi:hypothetical protein
MSTPISTPAEYLRIEESSGGQTVRFATPGKGKRDKPQFKIQVNYEIENLFNIEIHIEKRGKLEKAFEYSAEKSEKIEAKFELF